MVSKEIIPTKIHFLKTKCAAFLARTKAVFAQFTREQDMTLEQWERLERKYSPHSSHHAQIYFRDGGL